jgi:hypothetical protein
VVKQRDESLLGREVLKLVIMTPSTKLSAQSHLVIEAFLMEAKQSEEHWDKIMTTIEKLMGKVEAMEEERTMLRK